jgi:hypothetical protein
MSLPSIVHIVVRTTEKLEQIRAERATTKPREFSALFETFRIRTNGELRVPVRHGGARNRSQREVKERDNVEEYGGLHENV